MTRALSGFALVVATAVAVLGFQEPGRVPSGPLTFGAFTAEFDPAGTFAMSAPGWPSVKGPWTAAGAQIELAFPKGPFGCQDEGKYAFHREGSGGRIELISDDCKMRRMIFDKSVWRRAGEPAPVPARRIVRHPADKLVPLPAAASAAHSWPAFRGRDASGVADGHNLPDTWNATTREHIRWRTQLPGLAHSSPVVWGSQLFVTTAISSRPNASFKPGLYGDGDASDDRSTHRWMIYALDKRTGKILWERTAHTGEPGEKRHIKSTYASSTPATDGRIVVAAFGSQGVFAYDVNGNFRWRVELGRLNLGAYDAPTVEWGPASSPIIWNDLVIVQCDTHDDSFLIALNADTGETVWKTEREEIPSWGTPTVVTTAAGPQLVTNASNFIRGYDPRTGKELWRLGRSSKITAPTPILADGLIVVASGRGPERPIFVVRPTARGDITLADGQTNSDSVVWSRTGRGSYMPTPLAYQGVLYVLGNAGILDAYELATGKELYRERLPYIGSGFSASPVAADGKIYLSAEDGEIVVVRAGPKFNHIATNTMGELLMATPALSEGVMYVRSASTVFAIGR